ncbi:DUF411 domain-containing protein [Aquabacterium sp. A7-Y]|uniref:DUF411 domain-containing protein n=1 Tax=Aquabacterium sp. A7-Y TaxID=1349605 RepID=UPI00223E6FFF|nr:DUF411 domain-containing protein [Aquabacterium sp. A7-Y]MCW7537176.1 DUF411 domain-containing protein [Aquabacterium sp. A7-Y]
MFTAARRRFLHTSLALAAAAALPALATGSRPHIEVWKSESCGCCEGWVKHLRDNGFDVKVRNVEGPADYREKLGMPDRYGSCHTARVAAYVIEGHVPASEIHRLLKEKPAALGLAVPGMPVGSPGMEVEGRHDAYDVLLVSRQGQASVYRSYR